MCFFGHPAYGFKSQGLRGRGFGVRTSPICVPALYIVPLLDRLFFEYKYLPSPMAKAAEIKKKKKRRKETKWKQGRVGWKAAQNKKKWSKLSLMYGEEGDQYASDAEGLPDSSRGGSWPLTDASECGIGPSGGGDSGLRSIELSDAVFPGDGVLSRPREIFSLIARSLFTSCSR